MKITVLLLLLTVCEGSSSTVVGQVGDNITLPCTYDINYHGSTTICWGRGRIPTNGCSNQLIATDGEVVTERASDRYQLLSRLDQGNVSLTILNVTEMDSGQYGCRVHISGWFNDQKHQIQVIVESAVQTTTAATTGTQTSTEQTTTNQTSAAPLTSTENNTTSSQSTIAETEDEDSRLAVALVCGLFTVITVVTVIALVIISRRMFKHWKNLHSPQWLDTQLFFSSSSSTLQLQRQSSAVDNIYEVRSVEDEGGLYESPRDVAATGRQM